MPGAQGNAAPFLLDSLGSNAATQTFAVAPGTTRLLLTAEWENDVGSVPIEIQAPDGTIYTDADLANTPNMEVVDQFSDSTSAAIGVLNPEAVQLDDHHPRCHRPRSGVQFARHPGREPPRPSN